MLEAAVAALLARGGSFWAWCWWQRRRDAQRVVDAIRARDLRQVRMVLSEGADLSGVADCCGEPPLILAVTAGAGTEMLALLFACGAEIDERGTEWKTALIHTAARGLRSHRAWLLAHGADREARDMFGRTAADWAANARL
jgi:hypothetical protein